jgi:hypothetical protein
VSARLNKEVLSPRKASRDPCVHPTDTYVRDLVVRFVWKALVFITAAVVLTRLLEAL